MMRVLFSLGSNRDWKNEKGEMLSPIQILKAAVKDMKEYLTDVRVSSIYRTAPMYVAWQSDFFNMAVLGETSLLPQELLDDIHQTEARFGRDRTVEIKNGPRTLDIDIVYFDGESVHSKDLEVPHPRMAERAFVLVPSIEILQDDTHWDVTIAKMMALALKGLKEQRVEKVEMAKCI